MADGATDVSCLELEIVYAGARNDNTTVAKRKPEKKTVKVTSITAMIYFHMILIHPTVHI